MRIFLIIIALTGLCRWSFATNLATLSLEEFLQLEEFKQPVNLQAINTDLIELGVWHLSNIYRANKGKYSLSYDMNLRDAAQLHSQQMQLYRFFSHENRKNKAYSTLDKRAEVSGYGNYWILAENIYYSSVNVYQPQTYFELCLEIVQAFADSRGHRENLLATDVKHMGCGIQFDKESTYGYLYYYFTQDFGFR